MTGACGLCDKRSHGLNVTAGHRYIECNQQVQITGGRPAREEDEGHPHAKEERGLMHENLTDLHLLRELEPVVEKNLNRHLSMRKDWNPHDYIPWSDGKNYY